MNKIIYLLVRKKEQLVFFGCIFLFLLLIFKDPFSQRTLIPNFEPYPDTFHYINPALNLVKGDGFTMAREGRSIAINVPPLYSISLIPFFLLKADPRMAYYANVALALVSLFFFWKILKKILNNRLFLYGILFLYITNYFIYWFPSIVMAENLTLTLFLMALFFLISETSAFNTFIIALLAIGSYATKYSNIPITLTIIFSYIVKTIFSQSINRQKASSIILFLTGVMLSFIVLAGFEQTTKGHNLIFQILGHLSLLYNSVPKDDLQSQSNLGPSWFGVQYIAQNLPLYLNSLLGMPNKFLWDYTPIVSRLVGVSGLVGIIWSMFHKRFLFISSTMLLFLFSSIIFMSTFYSFDARYIYIAIPILLIGFGLLLSNLERKFFARSRLLNILVFIFLCFHLLSNFTRIKSQISLNLRYAETPWNYIAVLKMNEYFTPDKVTDGKKPVLISALPPFLIDYYTNGNYTLSPLSYQQEFREQEVREIVWGPNNYSNLPKLYKKYLNEGYDLYVSRAGLGNEGYTNRDFNTIVEEFETKLVHPGCYDQCNIYSVKLKQTNGQ